MHQCDGVRCVFVLPCMSGGRTCSGAECACVCAMTCDMCEWLKCVCVGGERTSHGVKCCVSVCACAVPCVCD